MANWKLQYRANATSFVTVVTGPDPAVFTDSTAVQAKKAFSLAADKLNGLEGGDPQASNWRRVLSDLFGYEYVGTSTTNTGTTLKAKMTIISTAATLDDAPTASIRTSGPGVFPAIVRQGSPANPSGFSGYLDEDRGTVTLVNGLPQIVFERKDWRVVLS
jgi:hypothetical protein